MDPNRDVCFYSSYSGCRYGGVNIELPPVPGVLLPEFNAAIATLEVIRKVKGLGQIAGKPSEWGEEAARILAMFGAGSL